MRPVILYPETRKGEVARSKILFLINSLRVGGAETLLLNLLRHLSQKGFEASLCYMLGTEADNSLLREFRDLGIEVIGLEGKGKTSPKVALNLYILLKKREIDILHTHLPFAGIVGRTVGKLARIPIIVSTLHMTKRDASTYFDHKASIVTHHVDRLTHCLADAILAISREVECSYFGDSKLFSAELLRSGKRKTFTIYNSVDLVEIDRRLDRATDEKREELSLRKDDVVLINVGRLVPAKGHHFLIEAMKTVTQHEPRARLLIVGQGRLEGQLKSLTRQLGLRDEVIFTGRREDVIETLPLGDLCVFPSLWEGFGMATVEAMAARKAVVATDIAAVREIIEDGKTGVLVPPRNSAALAQAILQLLGDAEKRQCMGEAGRRRVEEEFSIEVMARQHERLYEALVARKWAKGSLSSLHTS